MKKFLEESIIPSGAVETERADNDDEDFVKVGFLTILDKRVEKRKEPCRIQTHDLSVTRRVVYRCATAAAHKIEAALSIILTLVISRTAWIYKKIYLNIIGQFYYFEHFEPLRRS